MSSYFSLHLVDYPPFPHTISIFLFLLLDLLHLYYCNHLICFYVTDIGNGGFLMFREDRSQLYYQYWSLNVFSFCCYS